MANLPVRFDVFDRKISNFILMVNKMANFKLDSEVKKKTKKKQYDNTSRLWKNEKILSLGME